MSQLPPVDQMAQGAQRPQVADGNYPDTFKFTVPGEHVYGQVTGVRRVNTQYGDRVVIEIGDQQRGPIAVWLSNIQLQAALVEGNNQLGRPVAAADIVYIRFDGKQQLDGGRTVSNFAINLAAGNGVPQPAPVVGGFGAQPPAPAQQPAYTQPGYQPQQTGQQQWSQPAQPPPPAPQPAPGQQQFAPPNPNQPGVGGGYQQQPPVAPAPTPQGNPPQPPEGTVPF